MPNKTIKTTHPKSNFNIVRIRCIIGSRLTNQAEPCLPRGVNRDRGLGSWPPSAKVAVRKDLRRQVRHHGFLLNSKMSWMITAKHPRPPPSKTPTVAPQKVAKPTGATSCQGMMCRKKSGVILPATKPNTPPIIKPTRAATVTVVNVLRIVIACK